MNKVSSGVVMRTLRTKGYTYRNNIIPHLTCYNTPGNYADIKIAYKIGDCNKSASGNIEACVSDIKSIPKKVPVCLNVVSFAFKFTYKPDAFLKVMLR